MIVKVTTMIPLKANVFKEKYDKVSKADLLFDDNPVVVEADITKMFLKALSHLVNVEQVNIADVLSDKKVNRTGVGSTETKKMQHVPDTEYYVDTATNSYTKLWDLNKCFKKVEKQKLERYSFDFGFNGKSEDETFEDDYDASDNVSNSITPWDLLKNNKQIIMNGAPGTGKTFSARHEIADQLFGSDPENDKDIQMDMVQFHPSYDYTDFIEGIRPTMTGGAVGYTLKNGSFKKFCRIAGVVERILAAGKNVDENTISEFLTGEEAKIIEYWKRIIEKRKQEIIKLNDEGKEMLVDDPKLPPFLFIIDEINRAEISKVLGETMYCLDPDYRGAKGKIATQYSVLATQDSFFIDKENDRFFIPSNVYIIGTMNDIDRSVEVFDFALRRRFGWYEVLAEDVMDTVLKGMNVDSRLDDNAYVDYIDRIELVNSAISDPGALKLNRNYHLGHSYFGKILLYLDETGSNYDEARKKVWNNHIYQILSEYVKGKKTEEKLETIHKDFCEPRVNQE